MGSERHDGESSGSTPADHGDIADAYAPPAESRSRKMFFGVIALVALCVIVFAVALALD